MSAARSGVSNLAHLRVLVAIILIPPVLAAAWYGGVAMLVLALVAAGFGLHEYFRMARAAAADLAVRLRGGRGRRDRRLRVEHPLDARLRARDDARDVPRDRRGLGARVGARVARGDGARRRLDRLRRGVPGAAARPPRARTHFGFNVLLAVLHRHLGVGHLRLLRRTRCSAVTGSRPAISPNKTVEGFVIGLVFGAAAAWFTLYDQQLERAAGARGRRSRSRSPARSATSSRASSSAI